jgi:hypothetical protein
MAPMSAELYCGHPGCGHEWAYHRINTVCADCCVCVANGYAHAAHEFSPAKSGELTDGTPLSAAPVCVTCGRPESQHEGIERFCGVYATFRATPAEPIHDPVPSLTPEQFERIRARIMSMIEVEGIRE